MQTIANILWILTAILLGLAVLMMIFKPLIIKTIVKIKAKKEKKI